MCTYSMVGDVARDWFPQRYPWTTASPTTWTVDLVSKDEFEALKRDVELIKEMLKAAKVYDEKNGEPECETAEKVALIKKLAELVGVSLTDALPNT